MNEFEQYQYAEMMRQSRNSAIYHMLLTRKGVVGGNGKEDPSPPEPIIPKETIFNFADSPDETYLIEGTLDKAKMIELGLFDDEAYAWIKEPTSVEIGSAVTSIGGGAFYDCIGLTSVTIPSSVTSIVDNAFNGCVGLTSVQIPASVTTIGECAFEYCTSLTAVTIPDSVTSIGDFAFEGCSGLTAVTIPDSVTSIGGTAFASCEGLTAVTIPDSVTSIGNFAFERCFNLTSVTMTGKTRTTVQGIDNYSWGLESGCMIHCTDGNIDL